MGSSGDSVIAEAVVFMINTVYVACAGQWGMNAKLRIQPSHSGWGSGNTPEPEYPVGLGEMPVEFTLPHRHQ